MTGVGTGIRETAAVLVRADGDISEESLSYVRAKIAAVVDRQELPAVAGEVRVTRAVAQHTERPWSAVAEIRVGHTLVIAHAREATGHELADRLQDRLRGQVDRVVHRRDTARRSAAPPPWRRGETDRPNQAPTE